ncbi:MAG TPA: hypothetical protein VL547_13255 [Dinghuibacter sp.]|uniref:hypothetical protein n=1 Tax=Dinghuibacter sp. TaxID=2024697 RepID=UPI002C014839|nr:hypothetical protein [Dinghuibacter sp.]HTJ12996.1 hypothetical protein [Dinghuibacter sp.]
MLFRIYLALLLICFLSSLWSYRRGNPWRWRLFSALMGITLVVETCCTLLIHPLHIRNTMPAYNFFSLVETECYAAYFYGLLSRGWPRKVSMTFLWLYPLAWGYTTFGVFGLNNWNSYGLTMESVFCLLMSGRYLYEVFTAEELTTLEDNTDFWIAAGMLLYFACQFPLMGMLNFLNLHLQELAKKYMNIYAVLNILLYTIYTYAFLCRIITRKWRRSS